MKATMSARQQPPSILNANGGGGPVVPFVMPERMAMERDRIENAFWRFTTASAPDLGRLVAEVQRVEEDCERLRLLIDQVVEFLLQYNADRNRPHSIAQTAREIERTCYVAIATETIGYSRGRLLAIIAAWYAAHPWAPMPKSA